MTTSCRFELFVTDIDASIRFYTAVLDFGLERRDDGYASIVRDRARIGLGLITMLPEFGLGPGFTQERVSACRGAGVEIVIEASDLEQLYARVTASGHPVVEPMQQRPWALTDFRLVDPDGYYLRITHP